MPAAPNPIPKVLLTGKQKVYRGGGFQTNRIDIRTMSRHSAMPNMYQDYIGFRCALSFE
jgi:formylglycine-generating enzyme required for sulfatase activity